MAGNLLVGNFGDGTINRYDPTTHAFLGQLQTTSGVLSIDGLWALGVGNGGNGGSTSSVYFTAGPDGETHGLFGVLAAAAVPELQTWAMMIVGLGVVGSTMRRRRTAQPNAI